MLGADPLAAPLVPDIGISPPPELGTAVGAAFFAMIQHYGEGVTPGGFQVCYLWGPAFCYVGAHLMLVQR
jgi:hypothetical protein